VSAKRAEILVQHMWDSIGAVNDYLTWRAERGDLMRISEMLAEEPLYRTFQLDWDGSKTLAAGGSGAEVLTGT
jgi:hypothetical protein